MTFFESILKTTKSRMYGIVRSGWHHAVRLFSLPRLVRGARIAGGIMKILRFHVTEHQTRNTKHEMLSHSCLTNSLLRLYGLQKQGQMARLTLGVKKEDGKLLAHAWVENEGNDSDGQDGFKKLGTL